MTAKRKTKLTFGDMVAAHRTSCGLSFREAQEASGVDKSTIQRIELGVHPSLANFARLVKWTGVDANKVIGEFAAQQGQ